MAARTTPGIEEHPDIMALRARSERATVTPAAQAMEGLSVLAGLYLAASPWIVGFNGISTLTVSNLITGLAFAFMAVGFGTAYERTHGMSWAAACIGVWAVISPWIVSGAGPLLNGGVIASNIIIGIIAFCLAAGTAMLGRAEFRR